MKKELNNTAKNSDPLDALLMDIGLTKGQASVYRTLLNLGPSKAFKISFQSGVQRVLSYKILSQLEELGLVEVSTKEKVTTFFPAHPSRLESLINSKKQEVASAEGAYEEGIQNLSSLYNHANRRPNVRFWEGLEGVQRAHDDMLLEGKEIKLFRSVFDRTHEGLEDLLEEHIKRRAAKGIKTRALTPIEMPLNKELTVANDPKNLVTRKLLKLENFNLPAQIAIYGNKVTVVSYRGSLMTTIIDNVDISESAAALFELIWSNAIAPEEVFR